MGYFNFYIIRKFINYFFRYLKRFKKIFIVFIIFVCILFIKEKCFAVDTTPVDYNIDVFNDIIEQQRQRQNHWIYMMSGAYYANSQSWSDLLKPIMDDIGANQYDFYVTYTKNSNNNYIQFRVALFHVDDGTGTIGTEPDLITYGNTLTIRKLVFPSNSKRYVINYYPSTNEHSVTVDYGSWTIPLCCANYKSDLFYQFNNLVYNNSNNYTAFFNSVLNSLNNINTVDSNILTSLNTLSSTLNSINTNTSTNYSQQIGQISNKITDLLNDNDTIISQNSEMIQQQEQINDNLEQVSSDIQNVNDTITDDTVESSASDLPSVNLNNPTENGIDNIFTSIYNAFCIGEAQDIIFPIPFTDKNITLSPYYVRDALNNNNAGWVYTLIQAFWGYLIGRYIVSDISKKIDKIKSGNIENVENSNIKEEML